MGTQLHSIVKLLVVLTNITIITMASLDGVRGVETTEELGWQATGHGGAIAAGQSSSVAAGISILETGGNAADAAAATILALAVSDYGLFAIGPLGQYDRGHA